MEDDDSNSPSANKVPKLESESTPRNYGNNAAHHRHHHHHRRHHPGGGSTRKGPPQQRNYRGKKNHHGNNNNNNNNNADPRLAAYRPQRSTDEDADTEQAQEATPAQLEVPAPPPVDEEREFNARTWWMVDLSFQPRSKQGATALVARCMREYGWDEIYARRVLQGYRQLLAMKKRSSDWYDQLHMPSGDITRMWCQHIVDTVRYADDCLLHCGHFVNRVADADVQEDDNNNTVNMSQRKQRLNTTKQILESLFPGQIDKEMWPHLYPAAVDPRVARPYDRPTDFVHL